MKKPKKKLPGIRGLHEKAWSAFSRYIRSKDADFKGYTECFTCRKKLLWQEMDASHYIHGRLDFDARNIRPCCVRCNRYLHGNLGNYAIRLIEEMGVDGIKQLKKDAFTHPGYKRDELIEIRNKYDTHR